MKVYYDIEQGTEEWFEVKDLKFSASNASTILAEGAGLKTLIKDMLAEHYSSGNYEEYSNKYTNKDMERGKEFEDKARSIYCLEVGEEVEQVGFIEMNEHVGCSPDGLVGEDGLIEIKNFSDKVYLELLLSDKIEKKYFNQMQMQMFVSGRKWCDFFVFNPNFKEKRFYLKRVYPDAETFANLDSALKNATKQLLEQKAILDNIMKGNNNGTKQSRTNRKN